MPFFKYNNQNIHFRDQGQGDLLLILPGNTASSACHQGELDHFSDRYHTASIDFLGTGKSDRVAEWAKDWWLQGAGQVEALMQHLGNQKCIVMGTSGGAAAALLMAIHFPDSVRAVIADSCVEHFSMEFVQMHIVQGRKKRTPDQIQFWHLSHGDDWEQVVEADTAMLLRFSKNGGDWFSSRLGEIQCPVLLTASKKDTDLPDVVEQVGRMTNQIPDCRTFLNNRGDHPLMWSSPEDFRMISDYFLKEIEGNKLK